MPDTTSSEARERVLAIAEKLFAERGYAAVTLRDIAEALNIRQASLYYHVPGGKEALFVEVVERGMARHRHGLETAIAAVGDDLAAALNAAADWLLSQPPMDFGRMQQSDMPAISPAAAHRLESVVYDSLLLPVQQLFERLSAAGHIRPVRAGVMAGAFLAMINAIHSIPDRYGAPPKREMARELIEVLCLGLLPR